MLESIVKDLSVWTIVGFVGQAAFLGRFVVQWLVSEIKQRSYIPIAFWYLSIVGSLILLVYSLHKSDIVFIAGFSLNTIIYVRNLHLIYKHKKNGEVATIEKDEG
jgi:lipid-A-disaccharide synthase-like uncharacterized protein